MKRILAKLNPKLAAPLAIAISFTSPVSHAAQLDDAAIIAIYNQVNSMDIETALVGQVMGHSDEVRSLAKMVSTDHTGVRKMAHELALEIGITPTLPASRSTAAKNHYEVIAGLCDQSGTDFDKAYLLHEIEFHETAIKAVKNVLLPSTQSPKLKAHFNAVLPHFEHHLNETVRVAELLGVR